jgi:hypothetical protein
MDRKVLVLASSKFEFFLFLYFFFHSSIIISVLDCTEFMYSLVFIFMRSMDISLYQPSWF